MNEKLTWANEYEADKEKWRMHKEHADRSEQKHQQKEHENMHEKAEFHMHHAETVEHKEADEILSLHETHEDMQKLFEDISADIPKHRITNGYLWGREKALTTSAIIWRKEAEENIITLKNAVKNEITRKPLQWLFNRIDKHLS